MEETTVLEETPEEVQETSEPGEVEKLAADIGWRPDGELDAKAYILKSRDIQDTMRDHIKIQKKQLTDLGMSVAELKVHNERVYKAEVAKLTSELNSLKKEKKEAIQEGNVDRVELIEGQIDGIKEAMTPKKTDTTEFDTWVDKNKWYKDDPDMAAYADSIADANVGIPFKTLTELVALKIEKKFPDKVNGSVKKTVPSPVEGSARKIAGSKFTKADLTESQKTIMGQFVKQGIMTEKAYIEDIAKTQGV
jgi:hypothetical protein